MKMNEMFPSTYLKASDLPPLKQFKLTIVKVEMHPFTDRKTNEQSMKPVIFFAGKDKGMTLNFGNASLMFEKIAGDSDDWVGHDICVYNDPNVMRGKERTGGLRLAIPENNNTVIDHKATSQRAIAHSNGNGNGNGSAHVIDEPAVSYDELADEIPF